MAEHNKDILILGAGLCGLTLAYRLQQAGKAVRVLEARQRIGGRMETIAAKDGTPIEMGATWLGEKHTALTALLDELNIGITEQYLSDRAIYEPLSTSPPQLVQLPANDAPSYRIDGGSSRLINELASRLAPATVLCGQKAHTIEFPASGVVVKTETEEFTADVVVSTLPPQLLVQSIAMVPDLPEELTSLAMHTQTWMGQSIKFGFSFSEPFWRSPRLSGTLFSNVGPVNEMYDHSRDGDGCYGLKGFLSGAYASVDQEGRKAVILQQLRKYYGAAIDQYTDYQDRVWPTEAETFLNSGIGLLPHQNNGHAQYRQLFAGDRLFIAGSETADQFPGYMDGAVRSATWVFDQLRQ